MNVQDMDGGSGLQVAARCATRGGFTLAEVLAALVLVALVLPVALRVVGMAGGIGALAADRTLAVTLAQSKLDELRATGEWQDSVLQGDFAHTPSGLSLDTQDDGSLERFRWHGQVETWTEADLQQLSVTVTWERRGREHATTLTTLVVEGLP